MSFLPVRALIVEPHPFKRRAAEQVLLDLGCEEVVSAADADTALQLLQASGSVDIVLYSLRSKNVDDVRDFTTLSRRGLFSAAILCSGNEPDIHDALRRMTRMLGVALLGFIESPVHACAISPLLNAFIARSGNLRNEKLHCQVYLGPLSRNDLKNALASHAFKPLFKPTFDLSRGDVVRLDVCSRWAHPQYGWLLPDYFMPLLERFDLLTDLFLAQLEQGLAFLDAADRLGHRVEMAFHLPISLLGNLLFVVKLREVMAGHAIEASRLTFEFAVQDALEPSPALLETLILLRMLGVRLSIAGFGIGFSTLECLCQLPFNAMTLDTSDMHELEDCRRTQAVVSHTVALAKTLNMPLIVTGVHSQRRRLLLIQLGCTRGQGELYARAMSAEKLLPWLERQANWWRLT